VSGRHREVSQRSTYIIAACVALSFNVFVLMAQSLEKATTLKAIALTQEEPRFVAQSAVIGALVVLMTLAVKKFQPPAKR
jgi:hypothetical protein